MFQKSSIKLSNESRVLKCQRMHKKGSKSEFSPRKETIGEWKDKNLRLVKKMFSYDYDSFNECRALKYMREQFENKIVGYLMKGKGFRGT
jgi:hypothetical protein